MIKLRDLDRVNTIKIELDKVVSAKESFIDNSINSIDLLSNGCTYDRLKLKVHSCNIDMTSQFLNLLDGYIRSYKIELRKLGVDCD